MTRHLFILAGEPSGDLLGGRLMQALQENAGEHLQFSGVGGSKMQGQGLQPLFPMTDLTVFGLAEVLPKVPLLLRRLREAATFIRQHKPDVVITIDAPDFSFRLAKRLQGSGIRCIHYVAPTVWAWRPGRARKIQPLYQHLLALFPFEPPYFTKVGLPCTFVGHPLVEAGIAQAEPNAFMARHGLTREQPTLVILPGSRRSELAALLPVFASTTELLLKEFAGLQLVLPTLPHLQAQIAAATANWPKPPIIVTGDADKYAALRLGSLALAASGTVALELALANLPAVIAYKVHPLTYALYRRLIKVKYANLVNIMADAPAVPEFLQEQCKPDLLATKICELLRQPELRAQQQQVLQQAAQWLRPADGVMPSAVAARAVLEILCT